MILSMTVEAALAVPSGEFQLPTSGDAEDG
jgi:hypothetical protein